MSEQIHYTQPNWKPASKFQTEIRALRVDQEFILETAIAILSMSISEYVDKNIEYQELDRKINNPNTGILEIVPQLFQEKGLDIKDYCYNMPDDVVKAIARLKQEFINQGSTITIERMIELDREGAKFEVMNLFNINMPDSFWDNFRAENFNYQPKPWNEKFQIDSYLVKMALDAIYPDIFARASINHKTGKDVWLETTEERYDDLFWAMPLIFSDMQSFLMSEPQYHKSSGEAVYVACKTQLSKEVRISSCEYLATEEAWFLKLMTEQEYLKEFRSKKAS